MRFYFKSMARPKRVARTLQDIFPLEKLSQCQAWASQLYGYRDWHELEQITSAGEHLPSPDDEDLSPEESTKRGTAFVVAAEEILGIGLVDSLCVLSRLKLTSRKPVPAAKRATKVPKGTNPFYSLIQTELFEGDDRGGNASGSDEYVAFAIVPAQYGTEPEYRAKLVKLLKRKAKPYPGFGGECEQLLMDPCPSETEFFWEPSEEGHTIWLRQREQQRFYLFDEDGQPAGFLELSQTLEAASDRDDCNLLEMRIHEAWAVKDARWLMADIAATHFFGTVSNIAIARRPTQPMLLNLELISDSEHLFSQGFLEEVAELAADYLEIDPANIEVSYDV